MTPQKLKWQAKVIAELLEGVEGKREILPLGTKTNFGKVVGISYKDERYYFLLHKGTISLMPADAVKKLDELIKGE